MVVEVRQPIEVVPNPPQVYLASRSSVCDESVPSGPNPINVGMAVVKALKRARMAHEPQLVIHDLVKLLPNVQEMH